MRWSALLLVMALPLSGEAQEAVRILEDAVGPEQLLPGALAVRTLRVEAPDGLRLDVEAPSPLGGGAEGAGDVRVARAITGDGTVLWTFSLPFTAWQYGGERLDPVRVSWSGMGISGSVTTEAADFRVDDPLPGGGHPQPAPLEGPVVPEGLRWDLLPLAPLVLAGLTGAGWWRAGRRAEEAEVAELPGEPVPKAVDGGILVQLALDSVEEDAASSALLLAEAARAIPKSWGVEIHPWMTTREVEGALQKLESPERSTAIMDALHLADAWQFGRLVPSAEVVRSVGETLLEVASHA